MYLNSKCTMYYRHQALSHCKIRTLAAILSLIINKISAKFYIRESLIIGASAFETLPII